MRMCVGAGEDPGCGLHSQPQPQQAITHPATGPGERARRLGSVEGDTGRDSDASAQLSEVRRVRDACGGEARRAACRL